jgi:aspartate/methionine/tyrosine aminotransferase
LINRGVDVIDLGAGDADLAPPPAAVEALASAARDPSLGRYGFGLGYVPFREAISRWMERRFRQRFDPMTEIVPLIGSKEGIAHLAFGFLEPGDVAIVPEPGYMAYAGGTLLSDATVHAYALRPRTASSSTSTISRRTRTDARAVPQLPEQPDGRDRAATPEDVVRVPEARHLLVTDTIPG